VSGELAVVFTHFIAALKKMLSYLKRGISLERAYLKSGISSYEQLRNCFVAVIIVRDTAQLPLYGYTLPSKFSKAVVSVQKQSIYLEQSRASAKHVSFSEVAFSKAGCLQATVERARTGSLDD